MKTVKDFESFYKELLAVFIMNGDTIAEQTLNHQGAIFVQSRPATLVSGDVVVIIDQWNRSLTTVKGSSNEMIQEFKKLGIDFKWLV